MYKKIVIWCIITVLGLSPSISTIRGAEENTDKKIDLKTLSLIPAAEPVPALSYRLLPRFTDQKTGNAALFYYAATGFYPDGNKEDISEKIGKWRDLPFEKLNREEVKDVLSSFSDCFHQIKLATQRNYCQWEMPIEEGYSMQMPKLATFRKIIFALQIKIRMEVADGHIDKAMELIQQGMYMGRCIAEGPTLVQSLVGIAIEAVMLDEIESLMQRSGSPNFYWALTSLPDPLVDLHTSIQCEHEIIFIEFSQLKEIENEIMSPAQALIMISDLINKVQLLIDQDITEIPFKNILPAAWVMAHYSDAKKYLLNKGFSQERIDTMPAAQVVLIYQKQQYMEIADNSFKWLEIPYYQSQAYIKKNEQEFYNSFASEGLKANIFCLFMPALDRILFIQTRLERDIAMLRTIEAIRMFAANHSGEVPESLADITMVPIPVDPVTGREFIYSKIDKINARLEAPASSDRSDKTPVYELSIKK